jgi:hypothetical protein
MPETGNALSRNPNICASCSSMADGVEESTASENPGSELTPARMEARADDQREEKAAELAAHQVPR